jgi:hypothetical protein
MTPTTAAPARDPHAELPSDGPPLVAGENSACTKSAVIGAADRRAEDCVSRHREGEHHGDHRDGKAEAHAAARVLEREAAQVGPGPPRVPPREGDHQRERDDRDDRAERRRDGIGVADEGVGRGDAREGQDRPPRPLVRPAGPVGPTAPGGKACGLPQRHDDPRREGDERRRVGDENRPRDRPGSTPGNERDRDLGGDEVRRIVEGVECQSIHQRQAETPLAAGRVRDDLPQQDEAHRLQISGQGIGPGQARVGCAGRVESGDQGGGQRPGPARDRVADAAEHADQRRARQHRDPPRAPFDPRVGRGAESRGQQREQRRVDVPVETQVRFENRRARYVQFIGVQAEGGQVPGPEHERSQAQDDPQRQCPLHVPLSRVQPRVFPV